MSTRDHDEPLNAVEQYAAELLVARAWPETPAREPAALVTGQGRTPAANRQAARVIVACLALMVLGGVLRTGWEIGAAVWGWVVTR